MFPTLRQKQIRYGISQNEATLYITTLNPEPHTQWVEQPYNLNTQLSPQAQPVIALPHHIIWRKVYFFTKNLTPEQCYAQIIQALEQNIPIPLTDLHFDYQIQALDQVQRVAVFAVKKFFLPPAPKNAIFDCELHCLARALHYLNQIPLEQSEAYCYPFEQQFFQFRQDGLFFSHTPPEKAELLTINSEQEKLSLISLGAALWNYSASI